MCNEYVWGRFHRRERHVICVLGGMYSLGCVLEVCDGIYGVGLELDNHQDKNKP